MCVGVGEGEGAEGEAEEEGEGGGVAEGDLEWEGVRELLYVPEAEGGVVPDGGLEGVSEGVGEMEGESDTVGVAEVDADADEPLDATLLGVRLRLDVCEAVRVFVCVRVKETEGVAERGASCLCPRNTLANSDSSSPRALVAAIVLSPSSDFCASSASWTLLISLRMASLGSGRSGAAVFRTKRSEMPNALVSPGRGGRGRRPDTMQAITHEPSHCRQGGAGRGQKEVKARLTSPVPRQACGRGKPAIHHHMRSI